MFTKNMVLDKDMDYSILNYLCCKDHRRESDSVQYLDGAGYLLAFLLVALVNRFCLLMDCTKTLAIVLPDVKKDEKIHKLFSERNSRKVSKIINTFVLHTWL